jgi:ATP-dependent DNA ligase
MAYQTRRTKADLKMECMKNGILDKVNNFDNDDERVYKDDFIRALRDYYIKENYDGNPPKSIELLDENLISPMLAARFNQLKDEQQEEIWESDEWYFEEKEDGVRMLISFLEDEGFNLYSRNISVEDFLPISYGDTIDTEHVDKSKIKDEFIVDSELISLNPNISTIVEDNKGVVTETQLDAISSLISMEPEKAIPIQRRESTKLQYVIFDIIYWNGEWLFDLPLKERREYLEKAVSQLDDAGLGCRLPRSNRTKKKQFYKNIITEGGEGVIAKNVNYKYIPNSYRRKDGWIKIKRSMSESIGMETSLGDSIDAWVSGFKTGTEGKKWEDYVGALEFSVYLEDFEDVIFNDVDSEPEIHKIAVVASLPDDLRKEMTGRDEEGNPILKEEWYGKVAELDGQSVAPRSNRLRHARIINWRSDKTPNECRMDQGWLQSMVL